MAAIFKAYIGIDPGIKGGIGVIASIGNPTVFDMPILANKEMDGNALYDILLPIVNANDEVFCMLEKAQTMAKPGQRQQQGITGMFNYGAGYGVLKAILRIMPVPFIEIASGTWKKHFGVDKDKKKTTMYCQNLFPKAELYGPEGGLKDGRAEALLLAEYGRQQQEKFK